jgi:hypothetical protein
VYQLNELSVLKYVTWNGTKHFSSNNNINCYIEKKDNKFSNIYVKGSNEEIHQSLSEELFEEIHPNINKDFKAVIYALLTKNSQKDMEDYLDFINYAHIEEPSDTFLEVKEEIDNDGSDESEESLNEGNYESYEYTDSLKDSIEINDNKERELNSKIEELVSAERDSPKVNASGTLSSNSFDGETINNDFQQAYKITNNVGSHLKNGDPTNFTNKQSEAKNTNSSTKTGFEKEKLEKYIEPDHTDDITNIKSPDGLRVPSENPFVSSVTSNDLTSKANDISKESHVEVENISREGDIKNESLPYNKENRISKANDKKQKT